MSSLASITSAATSVNFSSNSFGVTMTVPSEVGPDGICRYRGFWYPLTSYRLITCAYCYLFIYRKIWRVSMTYPYDIVTGEDSVYGPGVRLRPDLNNDTSVAHVCGSVQPPLDCWSWKSCCRQAESCCQRQMSEGLGPHVDHGKTMCPRTWDGFACWSDTTAGRTETIQCPAYVPGVFSGTDKSTTNRAASKITKLDIAVVRIVSSRVSLA
ncbi:hypothetical protein Btru_042763 [Bulinus truncatus]|nr:hypothetical protein Btru_042763 [Bulinus truncatus]